MATITVPTVSQDHDLPGRQPRQRRGRLASVAPGAGAVLVVLALVWKAVGVPALLKFPTNLDVTAHYAGSYSLFVDPKSATPLDTAVNLPLTVGRHVKADGRRSGARLAVVDETLQVNVQGLPPITQDLVYVMNRRTMKNVADRRSSAYEPGNNVDRSGGYRLNFPFNLPAGKSLTIYQNETQTTGVALADPKQPIIHEHGLGLRHYNFDLKPTPLSPTYLAELDKSAKLPPSVTLTQLQPFLSRAGVDLPGLLAALSPPDRAALAALADQPIPLRYYLSVAASFGIEPTTGVIADVINEADTVGLRPDPAALPAVTAILARYQTNPTVAGATAKLTRLAAGDPIPLFRFTFHQTPESIASVEHKIGAQATQVRLAQTWVPLTVVLLGVILVAVGATGAVRRRRHGAVSTGTLPTVAGRGNRA